MNHIEVVEGSEAVALAVKACRPQVISAYPISPQTHIVERLANMTLAAAWRWQCHKRCLCNCKSFLYGIFVTGTAVDDRGSLR